MTALLPRYLKSIEHNFMNYVYIMFKNIIHLQYSIAVYIQCT